MIHQLAIVDARMRRVFTNALSIGAMLCLALIAGCADDSGGTVTPAPRSLTGNWGSPHYAYASLALTEANGNVTGHGWYENGFPVSVQGTMSGANVALTLTRRGPNNAVPLTFRGVWSDNALVGDIGYAGEASSGALTRVSLVRVDTVAESIGNVTFSNNAGAARNRNAVFAWGGTALGIYPASGYIDDLFLNTSLAKFATGKLAPGTYSIGPNGIFQAAAFNYPAVSGQVTIDRIASKMISGSFFMKIEFGSLMFDATGTFSASCPYDDLAVGYLKCAPSN